MNVRVIRAGGAGEAGGIDPGKVEGGRCFHPTPAWQSTFGPFDMYSMYSKAFLPLPTSVTLQNPILTCDYVLRLCLLSNWMSFRQMALFSPKNIF